MKIYMNSPNESWIVDRFNREISSYSKENFTSNIKNADLVWIVAPWTWSSVNKNYLQQKKVICTVHHLEFDNKGMKDYEDFINLDNYVDFYHVISQKTYDQLIKFTSKKIFLIPFWVNQNLFYPIEDKISLRKKYKFNFEDYLVGSFQRDSEGSDLSKPKLIKGPDRFIEIVFQMKQKNSNLKVLLTGPRRNYIINELNQREIQFTYFRRANQKKLNELYNILNLYIVSSRIEGAPQAILEAAASKTPVISTNVGIADKILNAKSIYQMSNFESAEADVNYAYENVKKYFIPEWYKQFFLLFEKLINEN